MLSLTGGAILPLGKETMNFNVIFLNLTIEDIKTLKRTIAVCLEYEVDNLNNPYLCELYAYLEAKLTVNQWEQHHDQVIMGEK